MNDKEWDPAATVAELTARMEEMAREGSGEAAERTAAEAEALLERLATALFPGGPGDRSSVTWPDRPAGGGDREGEPGPGGLPMTEQSRTEAKLRAAEARYRTLVEQIPAVTFMAVLGEERTRFT